MLGSFLLALLNLLMRSTSTTLTLYDPLRYRYGLGTAYLRKNKLRHAEHHFRRAVEINPSNAVLVCCVGQVRLLLSLPNFLDTQLRQA
jgi:hypothetical protein